MVVFQHPVAYVLALPQNRVMGESCFNATIDCFGEGLGGSTTMMIRGSPGKGEKMGKAQLVVFHDQFRLDGDHNTSGAATANTS